MLLRTFFILLVFCFSIPSFSQEYVGMTNTQIQKLLRSNSSEVKGQLGYWEAYVANRTVYVVTDSTNNRMRIISPILEVKELEDSEFQVLLEANFDRALDAKYSISNEVIWSSFTHPFSELTNDQFVDALHQVVNLVNNFGTSFSSTGLVFGGQN